MTDDAVRQQRHTHLCTDIYYDPKQNRVDTHMANNQFRPDQSI